MSSDNIVRVPSEWAAIHQKIKEEEECDELIAINEYLRWVAEIGLATEEEAKSVFKEVNAYLYLRCLFPIVPDDPMSKKLFQLTLHFMVLTFIVDDAIEKYNEEEMEEFISGYNFLENQVSEMFPKYPCISDMKESLSNIQNNFSRSATAAYVDYMNKVALILLEEGKLAKNRVISFRRRSSNSFSVYFETILFNAKTGCEAVSGREILLRRCFDGQGIFMYSLAEVFSKILFTNHVLPVNKVYTFYMLVILFSVVINDLYSYERDKHDSSYNIIKAWFNEKSVEDMTTATSKIAKILDAILQKLYLFVEEGKTNHPEISEWFQSIGLMTTGWIYVHQIAPRYLSSRFQVTPVEIENDMISDWLLRKDKYGQEKVQQFLEDISDPRRKTTMDFFYGSAC